MHPGSNKAFGGGYHMLIRTVLGILLVIGFCKWSCGGDGWGQDGGIMMGHKRW